MKIRRRSWEHYKTVVDACSNPKCKHCSELELHHIIPLKAGGEDKFDNVIILCEDCHRGGDLHLHSEWADNYDRLHKWKYAMDSRCKFSNIAEYVVIPPTLSGITQSRKPSLVIDESAYECNGYQISNPSGEMLPAAGIITLGDLADWLGTDPCKTYKMLIGNGIPVLKLSSRFNKKLVRLEDLRKME